MEVLTRLAAGDRERGVTLVETLAALLILGLVAVAVISLFTQGMALNAAGADYTSMTNTAKDKAEQLVDLPYDHAELVPDTDFSEPANANEPEVSPLITWRVAEHHLNTANPTVTGALGPDPMTSDAVGTGNLKLIRVTVASRGLTAIGRRDVTVLTLKARD